MITRDNAEALIPEDYSREIFQDIAESSIALRLMRRLPNMTRGQRRLVVLSALPMVYFVDGVPGTPEDLSGEDNTVGFKARTNAEWENKYVYAEEIAAIIPIGISTIEDADYDIWGELRPHIASAFGLVIDRAVFLGINAPATWPTAIVPGAIAAGNTVSLGSVGDLYDDLMSEDGLIALLEEDGYFPTGHVGAVSMRGALRGLRTTDGVPVFRPMIEGAGGGTSYTLDGEPIYFPLNGSMDAGTALMISGDWTRAVYSVRTDITYKVLDQAVIQDPDTGEILYNLAQQDMVALRMYMRLGWQLPNPINRMNEVEATRYPFSVLIPGYFTTDTDQPTPATSP